MELKVINEMKSIAPFIPEYEYMYKTEIFEVLKVALKYVPAASGIYDRLIFIAGQDLKNVYPDNEYVLCINRSYFERVKNEIGFFDCDPLDEESINNTICDHAKFLLRQYCEYNPSYVQISVAGLYKIKGTKQYIFEKSLKGPLKGKITLPQGHTGYDPMLNGIDISGYSHYEFHKYIHKETLREFTEEISGYDNISDESQIVRFVYPSSDFRTIDAYHLGIISRFIVEVSDIKNLTSNEPNKHEVIVMTEEELRKLPKDQMDSYVRKVFCLDD